MIKQECMRVDALDGLPCEKFMSRSSTDHLSIKPPNLTHDCTSLKPQQHRVLHDDQPIDIKKKHKSVPGSPNFKKIWPGGKVWLLNSKFKVHPGDKSLGGKDLIWLSRFFKMVTWTLKQRAGVVCSRSRSIY